MEEPQDQALPPPVQCSVSSVLSQLQGTCLKMLLELPGMKPDPEGSREQELRSNHRQEHRERAGLGSAEPWQREEG